MYSKCLKCLVCGVFGANIPGAALKFKVLLHRSLQSACWSRTLLGWQILASAQMWPSTYIESRACMHRRLGQGIPSSLIPKTSECKKPAAVQGSFSCQFGI